MQYQPKVLKGCKLRLLVNESINDTIKTYIYDGILYQVDSITRHITLAYGEGKYLFYFNNFGSLSIKIKKKRTSME